MIREFFPMRYQIPRKGRRGDLSIGTVVGNFSLHSWEKTRRPPCDYSWTLFCRADADERTEQKMQLTPRDA